MSLHGCDHFHIDIGLKLAMHLTTHVIVKLIAHMFAYTLNQGSGRTGGKLQMNWLSLRNNQLKFETSGELPIILEESIEYTSNEWKQNRKMSTCHRLDLESLGSWPTMPKNFPGIALDGDSVLYIVHST